jgi:ribosomal protein S6--L-glutamate ligase
MNIAILSRAEQLYSTQSLLKAGEVQNHDIEIIDPTYCNLMIVNNKAVLQYHDQIIDDLDAIIPRIGASNTYKGASIVRHFESMGVFSIASSQGIINSRDKWTCFQILAQKGIAMPKTTLGAHPYLEDFVKDFGDKPIIIKMLEGTHGQGVILCENFKNALATAQTLQVAGVKFVMQEFIEESQGTDSRAFVVDGEVVASIKRQSKDGDFRSNLHQGGSASVIQLSQPEKQLAVASAKALGLHVCGVDILSSKRGPLVLEVNSTPGLEGIETATGVNVSGKIIAFIEQQKK